MPSEVFFSFCSPALATRQSATAAAKIAISTGNAAPRRASMSRAGFDVLHGDPRGIVDVDRTGNQYNLRPRCLRRRCDGKALLAGRPIGDVAHGIDRLMGWARP